MDALAVILDDAVAGTLTRLSQGRLRFDYDDEYRGQTEPTPLSLSMPTQVKSHLDNVVTPWLWGLLPDNEAVLSRWARQFHVSASSPFALLGSPIGEDCAGAVRFTIPNDVDRVLNRPGDVVWLSDDQIAERLRDLQKDSTSWLGRSFTGQFSLAGAKAKTALLRTEGKWGVPSGSIPTTHILKPAVSGFDDHDLNEHLCLDAARRAGLIAVRTTIGRFGEESAVIVDRYDRVTLSDRIVRVHQEDLCQALGISPLRKYQNEGGPSPRDIAGLFRRAMPPRIADEAIWRFADALIWNWFIAGTDAHAKNYSVLLANNQVRLAPMYDVASALPYGTHERKLRMAMKIGGDYRVHPERNTWPEEAKDLGVDPARLVDRVKEIGQIISSSFADAAREPAVLALERALPVKLVDLISDRVERCMRVFGARTKVVNAYANDVINGREVPPLVITSDHVLTGVHNGTVQVEGGRFEVRGQINGTLALHPGVEATIAGTQAGTVQVDGGASVVVTGSIKGTTRVSAGALVVVERSGMLAGTLNNDGRVIVRGVFGGAKNGSGELTFEDGGYEKQPVIRDGVSHYEW